MNIAHDSSGIVAHTGGLLEHSLLLSILAASVLAAADAPSPAQQLVSLSNRAVNPRGIAVVPEGGPLARDLVEHSQFLVVDQEPDPAKVQTAALAAADQGWLATRLYVAESEPTRLVTGDRVANLVVYADTPMAKLDLKRLVAKLAPNGGQAMIRGGTVVPGLAEVEQRVVAGWLILTRGPVACGAEWTHRLFDPSNAAYSTDTAFAWPPLTQWIQKPYHDGGNLGLLAGGRVLTVWQGGSSRSAGIRLKPDAFHFLLMRDANNGIELWRRQLDPTFAPDLWTSPTVLTAGRCTRCQPLRRRWRSSTPPPARPCARSPAAAPPNG